jgi:hypothetical protein
LRTAIIELHYLPCIAYFSALASFERIVVEKYEHYEKQTYRNRCYIKGPHQVEALTIPVTGKHQKPLVRDVRVDYSQKWLNNHLRTIQTGYGKAPYFEYFIQDLHDILLRKPVFLYDLNLALMTMCLKWLKRDVVLEETQEYVKEPSAGVTDLRGVINPKKEEACNRFYKSTEYQQVFGSMFVPNLSLMDLIFNQGPGAWAVVKASAVK